MSRSRGKHGNSGTRDQQKTMAKSFDKFLEENSLKTTMERGRLQDIYKEQFLPLQTFRMPFGRVLNALTYHLGICQEVKGSIVFGGGEEAALHLLSTDDKPVDALQFLLESHLNPYCCLTCRKSMQSAEALRQHQLGVKHRQQEILKKIRESLTSPELVRDKLGVAVTSLPEQNEDGVIEYQLPVGQAGIISLTVKNASDNDVITIKDCTLLWSSSYFDYKDIARIDLQRGRLNPGKSATFKVGCRRRSEFGHSYVPVVFTLHRDAREFHIMRFISVRITSDLYNDLKVQAPYERPRPSFKIPYDIVTTPGLPLPKLRKNGLKLERVDKYDIPIALKAQVVHNKQVSDGLRRKLMNEVSFETYKDKFSTLLHIEEIQMQRDIRNYDLKGVTFVRDNQNPSLLILQVPGLAENRPSVLRGDHLFAYEPDILKTRYEGIVHVVELERVKIGFDHSMPFIKNKKFDVQFTFSRLPIQMQHRACSQVVGKKDLQQVLFPDPDTASTAVMFDDARLRPFYDRNLNKEQQMAVRNILLGTSRPAPYLIFGPPGTGKTVTMVEAIKQVHNVLPDSFILACAPENSAADLLAERLLPHIDKGKMFRMYATSRPWKFVPQTLKDARVVNFEPVTGEVFYPSKEELMKHYRVIVTTLITAGRLVSANFPRGHFTHIFIDEAGHAVEPECTIPVMGLLDPNNARGGQLVLAGDPKQLGPIIRSPIAQQYGLDTSFLERLMTSNPVYRRGALGYSNTVLTKLVNNYRSHKTIIEIPKKLFYDDELNECAGEFRDIMLGWEELPNPQFPVIFHPVFGMDEREGRSPSFFNVAEVETIERYLKKLLDESVRSRKVRIVKPEMIGIISPYKRQVQKIQKMVEKRRFGNIKVGSVEEFQGQERRIIIVSTVRSANKEYLDLDRDFRLGFLNNPKRFNVAVTRAQALLILIGNPEMLTKDANWLKFIDFCQENEACVKVASRDRPEIILELLKKLTLASDTVDELEDQAGISQRELHENPEWTRHE